MGAGTAPIPLFAMIDVRHKLTALIKSELYGGGDKNEGRAALRARQGLDELFLEPGKLPDDVTKDLMRATVLVTLAEQSALLTQARDAGGGSIKGIKAELFKLIEDPDRFDRFIDADKAAICRTACGVSFLVKRRLHVIDDTIRGRGIPYMAAPVPRRSTNWVRFILGALAASAISVGVRGGFAGLSLADIAVVLLGGAAALAALLALFSPLLLLRVIDRYRDRRAAEKAAKVTPRP